MSIRRGAAIMTELLEKAIVEVTKLPETEQNALAQWILDELAWDRRWDDLFARSQSGLEKLAAEALAEFRAGKTEPLDPDKL
jgi:hypothetical protein